MSWRSLYERVTRPRSTEEVTGLLIAIQGGDKEASDRLMQAVYPDLKKRSRALLRREGSRQSLQPSVFVNETYLRLVDQTRVAWQNRAHFLGVAAALMRRILVDHARSRKSRQGGGIRLVLDEALASFRPRSLELLALDDALNELAELDPRQSRVVELRAFGGLSVEETAEVMGISPATVKRYWSFSRAWLARRGPPPMDH